MKNREIKFRAWDSKEKKWLLGYEYPNLGGFSMFGEMMMMGEWASILSSYFPDRLEDIELMQYTGLKDKNGEEIYEGDIVRILYSDWGSQSDYSITLEQHKINKSVIGTVIFEEGNYILDFGDYTDTLHHGAHGERTILGNIYENPELLK